MQALGVHWWQAVVVALTIGLRPVMRAIALIMVARLVPANFVKTALPLVLTAPKNNRKEPDNSAGKK